MSEKKKIIFLTGATGLLGSYLLKMLLEPGHEVYCLARSKKDKTAGQRIADFLRFWDDDSKMAANKKLHVIEGDITLPDLGISDKKLRDQLAEKIEIIFHSAALAELRVPLEKIRKINVEGTKNVFDFAMRCFTGGCLRKVNHLSTVYVVGDKNGIEFSEDMLDVGQSFHNTYEQSKYEAEVLASEYKNKGLPIAIFRPSMVMGESRTGKTTNFRLIYEPLHFFSNAIYDTFPADPECFQNLICLDSVAEALFALGLGEDTGIYHLVSSNNVNVKFFLELASDYFGFRMPKLIPLTKFDFSQWSPAQKMLATPFIPYFNNTSRFLAEKTLQCLGSRQINLAPTGGCDLVKIFNYCEDAGYIKSKNKNEYF